MPKIKLNGKEIEAPASDKLLKVALDNGAYVPHYCWHPGLKPHGNCRMCLVKVSNSRKLEVACMYNCTEGLEVTTESPEIDAARKGVLEYMLINHPLDCPICDKAGECDLQDFTYKYRHGVSRFVDDKVVKHTKDLGPTVKLWGSRCISCTRCVRFTEEITGTSELSLVNRGDHSVVDVHPEIPLDNPMSLNVVDICPVGALIDKSFLFQARVWFAKSTESVCASCSRGCNVDGTVLKNEVKRLTPRVNHDVNGYWMCDHGRLNKEYLQAANRVRLSKGTTREIGRALGEFATRNPGQIAILASTYQTIEELHLLKMLGGALQAPVGFYTLSRGERYVSKSGFVIETDKTPNRFGAMHLFGREIDEVEDEGLRAIVDGITAGRIKALVSFNGVPDPTWPRGLLEAIDKLDLLVASDILDNPVVQKAHFVVPGAAWAEKDGTFMNRDGRVQRVRPMAVPPGMARPELVSLQEILVELGALKTTMSPDSVFRLAMPGLDHAKVGRLGVVPGSPEKTIPAPSDVMQQRGAH